VKPLYFNVKKNTNKYMPKEQIYLVDLDKPLPDISEEIKSYLAFCNDFQSIRLPRALQSEIQGSNHTENYSHFELHVSNAEAPPEDLVFLNFSALPYLKALQTLAKNSLKELKPDSRISNEDILKAVKWLNIQKLIVEIIQFLEGFGSVNVNGNVKNEMLSTIYNRNLGDLNYIPDDWVSLLERNRFDIHNINKPIFTTPRNYKKYILKEGFGYKELDKDQYISFDILELYKKQIPIIFDDLLKIAEKTCKVRSEVREKYKPNSN
jgi:hypothetical protein